jgi:DNA-binding transcriptional LysR family regulator
MAADPFDLNLRHLRALLSIAEKGSITAAADSVSLSQPALTQGLAKLERQFGYTMFERRSGGMVPTPMGAIVIERTRAALDHLSQAAKGLSAVFQYPERLMTMTQLRAFLALAEAGGFSAAAHSSGMSQTAVHRAVSDLEHMIGGQLVERRGRAVWLNPAGRRLARGARLAVAEIIAAVADLGFDSGSELIALARCRWPALSGAHGDGAHGAKPSARRFQGAGRQLARAGRPLRDGEIDMIVGALRPFEIADLYQMPLYEDRLVIAAGSQHPLAEVERPTLEQLGPILDRQSRQFAAARTVGAIVRGRTLPETPIECGSVMIIGRLLTEGNFLTLLSPDQVALQIRSGLLAQIGAPLEHSRRLVGITTRRSWRPTATQRHFLDCLEKAAAVMRSDTPQSERAARAGCSACQSRLIQTALVSR